MIYDSYVGSQKKDIENQLKKVLKLNEEHMKKSLANIEFLLDSKKELTKKTHLKSHYELKKNRKYSLNKLRKKLKKQFNLSNQSLDIELFLIDKNYKVIDSTHKKNLGLNLSLIKKSKQSLETLKNIDDYNRLDDVSVDFLDYEIKSFSYSKLSHNLYLGLGMIYENSIDEKKSFDEMREIADTNMNLFCVMQDGFDNQYFESLIEHRKKFESNEEYLKSKEKFPLSKSVDNHIINTSRNWEVLNSTKGNTLSIYFPLMKEKNPIISIPGDIVLQIDLDISEQNKFTELILTKLILFILIHFILIFLIFYFTNKYQNLEKKLKKQILKNEKMIDYNKRFISNLVHQIRTPLSIIMSNISLLEVLLKKNVSQYTIQINASINMLSNSYENLSYFLSFNSLNYNKRKIELSKFIKNRVCFFEQIAQANNKNIITNIKSNKIYEINDIELERVIDNSISNALYFCDYGGNILISLEVNKISFKIVNLKNKSIEVLNKDNIDYMKDLSSLGLGVFIIKKILYMNDIDYKFENRYNKITFEYLIKS